MPYTIGIEIGGTQMRAALLSTDHTQSRRPRLIGKKGIPQSLEQLQPQEAIRKIVDLAKLCVSEANVEISDIEGIGVAVPEAVHPITGRIESPTLLRTWKWVGLVDMLEEGFSTSFQSAVSIVVDNDANLAAWGEYKLGEGRSSKTNQLIFLMISTGIGAGIVINESLYLGSQGFAGEFGHIVIDPSQEICLGCHQHGCLEVLASGVAIAKGGAKKVGISGAPKILNAMLNQQKLSMQDAGGEWAETTAQSPQGQSVNALAVLEASENGDPDAIEVVTNAGRFLGNGLVQILHSLNPSVLVLGGGVPVNSNVYIEAALDQVNKQALSTPRSGCLIVPSLLGSDAPIFGAAYKAGEMRNNLTLI